MELSISETLKLQPWWVLLLSSCGVLITLNFTFSVIRWLDVVFLRRRRDLLRYGQWAVVTGSTDGIGKAISFELSRRGLSLVLVGRNSHKLDQVASSIKAENPKVQIKTVVLDLDGDLTEGVQRLREEISLLDVGLLLNNAGMTYDYGTFLHEDTELWWKKIVRVNLEGLTTVTSVVLPFMLSRKKGAIVNIGSGSSTVIPSHPLFSVYAATKAYVHQLSRNLHVEYKQIGIDVQCQIPLYVATKMVAFKKSSFFTPSPSNFARYSADRIGSEHQCMPYWPHNLQGFAVKLVPDFLLNKWRLSYGLSRRQKKSPS
ncbi:very-long-chain 3-oxoacyl-CoA reductase 1-like [Wolffia australiana]